MPIIYALAAAYALGALAGRFVSAPMWLTCAAALAAGAAAAAFRSRQSLFLSLVCASALFASWFSYQADEAVYHNAPLARYLENRDNEKRLEIARGTILRFERREDGSAAATMKVDGVRLSKDAWLRVDGVAVARFRAEAAPARDPAFGELWELEGWMKPASQMSRASADYHRARDASAMMTVAEQGSSRPLGKGNAGLVLSSAASLRDKFRRAIDSNVSEPYNLILGYMALGRTGPVDQVIYDKFRRAGVVHVLVVSGMHVGVMLGALFIFGFLWNRRPVPSFLIMGAALLVYYFVAGGGPSITRAVVMGFVMLFSLMFGAGRDSGVSLCLAALFVMVVNPSAPFQIGTQLTFLASAGVIFIYPAMAAFVRGGGLPRKIARFALASIAAQMPLFPVLAYHFNQFCAAGLVSNALVVPLAGVLLPADFLLCAAGLLPGNIAAVPAVPAEALARLMTGIVELFAAIPFGVVDSASPPIPWMALYGAGVVLLTWTLRRMADGSDFQIYAGWAGIAAVGLTLAAWGAHKPPVNGVRAVFFDVGQGDASLIEMPAREDGRGVFRLLADGGGGWENPGDSTEPGERLIGRHLRRAGVRRLDAILLTHPDADHMNGLQWVVNNIRADRFIDGATPADIACEETGDPGACRMAAAGPLYHALSPTQEERYRALLRSIKKRGVEYVHVSGGATFELPSGARLKIFGPNRSLPYMRNISRNNLPLTARASFRNASVLIAGDIEREGEERLVRRYGAALKSDLLKAPHHGSASSSSEQFLRWVAPRAVVVSSGGPRVYGHPHKDTLERYRAAAADVFRTDLLGTVTCLVPASGAEPRCSGSVR
ncbi:MAG TPA: ComEC/Rec2 family competence protein [bacterium]|nr:ComEC/Rec2 family competence protein [bacterium]